MKQYPLFQQYTFEEFTKKDGVNCPHCGTKFRTWVKYLDDRLISLGYRALGWTLDNHKVTFRFEDITKEHKEICDMQKLKWFGIIKKSDIPTRWKITDMGFGFLVGDVELSQRIWVVADQVIKEDEIKIRVENAKKRWQVSLADYRLDYRPLKLSEYKTMISPKLI